MREYAEMQAIVVGLLTNRINKGKVPFGITNL